MAAPALIKKKQRPEPSAAGTALRSTDANCVVAQGTHVEGDFRSEENIRLDGSVRGTVHCSKRLVVGEKGIIEGEIKAATAVIAGRITGNLVVEGALQLTSTAKIEGDISAKRMSAEEGAVYNGACRVGA
ncbi:MAG: polymer-forming cytoskeletal protein [Phaeodactylibacter sp.]|uniref:bactofilin family protein n=1 Tax=Phaeodactylibacter sp. TaxID=1940289 RepID=UPI0032ED1E12